MTLTHYCVEFEKLVIPGRISELACGVCPGDRVLASHLIAVHQQGVGDYGD